MAFHVIGADTFAAKQAVAAAGIDGVQIQAFWDRLQAGGAGTALDPAQVTALNAEIDDARSLGLTVSFEYAPHYPPAWVKAAVEPFTDQTGQAYTSTDPGKDVRDWVWTELGRQYLLDFMTKTYAAITPANRASIAFVKFGGGYFGEIQYPVEFRSSPISYWGFGSAQQTGTGLADGLAACPVPGYSPFTGSDAQDVAFINWYLGGLEQFVGWQIEALKVLGFTCPLYALHSGFSVRANLTRAGVGWRENFARGHDFTRMVGLYKNDPQVWPWSTWINGGTSFPDSPFDSDQPAWAKLYAEASVRGKHWRIGGENTGGETNAGMDGIFGNALAPVLPAIGEPLYFGRPRGPWQPFVHMAWLNYADLTAGTPKATLAHYAEQISNA